MVCWWSRPEQFRGSLGAQIGGRFIDSLIDGAKPIDLVSSSGLVLFLAFVTSMSIWSATHRITERDINAIFHTE